MRSTRNYFLPVMDSHPSPATFNSRQRLRNNSMFFQGLSGVLESPDLSLYKMASISAAASHFAHGEPRQRKPSTDPESHHAIGGLYEVLTVRDLVRYLG